MTGDKYNYYLKIILNAEIGEYARISEMIANDFSLTDREMFELDFLVRRYLSNYNAKYKLRVVNSHTGMDESPPKRMEDDFGGLAIYRGEENMYGVKWFTYSPSKDFESFPVKRWYYNERIAGILNETLTDVIPGRYQGYFDTPPWILGSIYAPGTKYVPLHDLIETAIATGKITRWEYLATRGVPADFVKALRGTDLRFTSDPRF